MWELFLIAIGSYLLYDYLHDLCWWVTGPTNWFGIGNTVTVVTNYNRILDYILECANFTNSTFTWKLIGFPRYIVTNNVQNMQYVLKENFDNFVKGPAFKENLEELLGDGIFSQDGHPWKTQRQAAAKIFNVNNFRSHMMVVFVKHLKTVTSILQQPKSVDLHGLMHKFTLDSFTEIGFGESVHSLGDKESAFAVAFDTLQQMANESFFVPKLILFFKNLIQSRPRQQYRKTIDTFSYQVIQTRLQAKDLSNDDLLSHFLRMKKESGETYKPQDLRNIVMNFIIAGRDTTAQAISWVVFELKNRQDIVDKIRAEVKSKIADINNPTYDEIKSLEYTSAVFMESLRLHPSVPKNIKYAVKDDMLPDGTKIKAGWGVCWSPYCMARTPEIWGEDCLELKPERFLDQKYDPTINLSFHYGPRVCLGQNMAVLEAVATMATLYSKFDIEVLNKEAQYNVTLTLQMKNPLMVNCTLRK